MIWRSLAANAGWKLASIVVAVLLWIAILGAPEVVTTQSVPIFFKALPRDLLVTTNGIDRVSVEVRGPSSKVTPSSLADTAVVLLLSDVTGPGERTFTLSDANISLPEGVRLTRVVPSQLRLGFDRILTREVPVAIQFGKPAPPGYRLMTQDVTPSSLTITGPEAQVSAIQTVPTDRIDLTGITESTSVRVNTYVPGPQVRFASPSIVTVRISMGKIGN